MIALTAVSPASGITGGRELVEVLGSGFDLSGIVTVKFGGVPASAVRVISSSRLDCLTPPGVPGSADVMVENVDLVEAATLPGGFAYSMPDLTRQSPVTSTAEALAKLLAAQVLADNVVVQSTHPDYHDGVAPPAADGRATDFSELPQIILRGPDLVENRDEDDPADFAVRSNGTYVERRTAGTWDLQFDLVVRDGSKQRLLNLVGELIVFFRRNPKLAVPRDPLDVGAGEVEYRMRLLGRFTAPGPDPSDLAGGIVLCRGLCLIEGVRIELDRPVGQGVEFLDLELGSGQL